MSQAGCLVPFLIVFNLFFGWLIFKPLIWLAIEGVLVIIFLLNSFFISRKIGSQHKERSDAIDVEGTVVDGKDVDGRRVLK